MRPQPPRRQRAADGAAQRQRSNQRAALLDLCTTPNISVTIHTLEVARIIISYHRMPKPRERLASNTLPALIWSQEAHEDRVLVQSQADRGRRCAQRHDEAKVAGLRLQRRHY